MNAIDAACLNSRSDPKGMRLEMMREVCSESVERVDSMKNLQGRKSLIP